MAVRNLMSDLDWYSAYRGNFSNCYLPVKKKLRFMLTRHDMHLSLKIVLPNSKYVSK